MEMKALRALLWQQRTQALRYPQPWYVKPAFDLDAKGRLVHDGWHLMEGDAWRDHYRFRFFAQREADRQNADLIRMAAQWGDRA